MVGTASGSQGRRYPDHLWTLGKGLNNDRTKGPITLSLTDTGPSNCFKKPFLCLVIQARVSAPGCLISVLHSEEGNRTFSEAQGKTRASAPESEQGKDLPCEGGSEGIDVFLGDSVDKGHPAYLVVKAHLHLSGLLLQGQPRGEGTQR